MGEHKCPKCGSYDCKSRDGYEERIKEITCKECKNVWLKIYDEDESTDR